MPRISVKLFIILQILFLFAASYSFIFYHFKTTVIVLFEYVYFVSILAFFLLLFKKRWQRYLFSITLFTYNVIVLLQSSSFFLQRRFISVTAIENYGKINLIPFDELYYYYSLILFSLILSCLIINIKNEKLKVSLSLKYQAISYSIVLFIILFLFPISPLVSLVYTINGYLSNDSKESIYLNPRDLSGLNYVTVDQSAEYPFLKEHIYKNRIQFKRSNNYIAKPNIIHFFVEGISARTIGSYNEKWKNLTPNIDKFRSKSMLVTNYFSHTQATYRGIRGQLSSIYPSYGGSNAVGWATDRSEIPEMELLCLPHILKKNGYYTEMLVGSSINEGMIGEQCIKHFGFQRVVGKEQVLPKGENQKNTTLLPDSILMNYLIKKLKDDGQENPFYYSIYTTQTHSWLDSLVGNKDKVFSDGTSETLNTIHNYDFCFGSFYRYFQVSEYLNNTVIIFSTDHCHFPSNDFIEVVDDDEDYQPFFFDRVPLIIYDPTHELPNTWGSGLYSTVDLVPSILHLLEFPNHLNHFLGNSIFSENMYAERDFVPFYGNEFLIYHKNEIFQKEWISGNHGKATFFHSLLDYQRSVEKNNRLWSRSFDSEIKTKQLSEP